MTRLDENRAKSQLHAKAGVRITAVSNLAIWGNHSATQYPDFYNARINGRAAAESINDDGWLKGDFITTVQQRGAAIIKARGALERRQRRQRRRRFRPLHHRTNARRRLAQRLSLFGRQLSASSPA